MTAYKSMKDVGVKFTYVDNPHKKVAKFKKSVEALDLPHFKSEARSESQTKSRLVKFINHINKSAKGLHPKISDRLKLKEEDEYFHIEIKSDNDTSIPELVKYVLTDAGKRPFAKRSRLKGARSSKHKGVCGDLGKRKCEKLKQRSTTFKRHKSLCKEYDEAHDKYFEVGIERGRLLKEKSSALKYSRKVSGPTGAGSSKFSKPKSKRNACKFTSSSKSLRKTGKVLRAP